MPTGAEIVAECDPAACCHPEALWPHRIGRDRVDRLTRATETGNYAMTKLRALQKHHPIIGEVRGLGLMIGVELVKDAKLTPATSEAEAIRDALLRSGVLVGVGGVYGNVIRFQPPLIITRMQIDQAIDAFAAALQEVAQPAAV